MNNFLAVVLGGAIGASMRYLCILKFGRISVYGFNIATLLINACGCFLAGLIFACTENKHACSTYRIFFITGMIGAFTTLAAFGLESIYYLRNGNWLFFLANIFSTNTISLLMIWLGIKAAELFK